MNKTFLVLMLATLSLPLAARGNENGFSAEQIAAARENPAAYTIDPDSIRVERVRDFRATSADVQAMAAPTPPPVPVPPIDPQIIVNIGKVIWDIIQSNRPVVDVKNSYATGVPDGVQHWTDLAGWNQPDATEFDFSAKNMKGDGAIRVRYLVLRISGGSYQGVGQYLTGVTIEPLEVSVNSGYEFSLEATVPKESLANVGTTDNPIAGMVARLNWTIKTVGNENHGSRLYYVQGDGYFNEITGMTGQDARRARRRAARLLETTLP